MRDLLKGMIEKNATDLHLIAGSPPLYRIYGELYPVGEETLSKSEVQKLAYSVMTEEEKKRFEEEWEIDFSFGIPGFARFRANVYKQNGSVAVAIRMIPYEIMPFEKLGVPMVILETAFKMEGLILVTGPSGSGKSTTLAAIIDAINKKKRAHVITIEDPIEYVFKPVKSVISQRQVKVDTKNFATALKHVLREDPDVVMVGEMRDLETVEATLFVAETGVLTLATLHTRSAAESIQRILDMFPAAKRPQVRAQLAFSLKAVVSQLLLPRKDGKGRVLACEVMIVTPPIKALIREEKIHQIYSMIQSGQKYGMQTMNQSLANLYNKGLINLEIAYAFSPNPQELQRLISTR